MTPDASGDVDGDGDTDADIGAGVESASPLLELVRRYGRADAHHLAIGVGLQVLKSFIGFADVFVIGLAIDALFTDQPLVLPLIPAAWTPAETIPLLFFAAGLVAAVNLVTIAGGSLSDVSSGIFAQRILHRIRVDTFDTAQHHDLATLDDHRTGDVMSVLNDDVNQLETFFTILLGAFVWITVTLIAAVAYMSVLNWQLAAFVLLSAPVVAAVNYWYSRRLKPLQADVRSERGALNAHLESGLGGVGVVKAFTAEDHERDRVEQASLEHFRARFRARKRAVQQAPVNRLIVGVWLLATLAIGIVWILDGAPLVFTGTLTVGQLVPFLFYMERVTLPLKNLSGVIDGYHGANAAARRILGLSDTGSDSSNRPHTRSDDPTTDNTIIDAPTMASGAIESGGIDAGEIEFDDVTFAYPGTDERAVQDVSFDVDAGETVGLVGSTGAGKSTLVKLLLRLYDPDTGTIKVDGRDTQGRAPHALRAAIGYVNQDAFLFNGTVRYNVAYGAEDGIPDDRIRQAAREAGVHEDVVALPDGYDTEVGDRGVRLSGGQRQRLAIARAIVSNPPMLVLDEATSHVDNETERIVQRQLDELTEDRTTFVVAHRLSTVRNADRILVLDDGQIAETGTHDELVDHGGAYATLWNIQVGNADAVAD